LSHCIKLWLKALEDDWATCLEHNDFNGHCTELQP